MQRTCTNTESVARPNLLILSILLILSKPETQNGVCPQRKREMCCYSCALQVNMLLYCLLQMEKGYETTDKAVSKGSGRA